MEKKLLFSFAGLLFVGKKDWKWKMYKTLTENEGEKKHWAVISVMQTYVKVISIYLLLQHTIFFLCYLLLTLDRQSHNINVCILYTSNKLSNKWEHF